MSYFRAEPLAANHLVLSVAGGVTEEVIEVVAPLEGTLIDISYLEGTLTD